VAGRERRVGTEAPMVLGGFRAAILVRSE
jgi:hypothetical protein